MYASSPHLYIYTDENCGLVLLPLMIFIGSGSHKLVLGIVEGGKGKNVVCAYRRMSRMSG